MFLIPDIKSPVLRDCGKLIIDSLALRRRLVAFRGLQDGVRSERIALLG